VVVSAQKATIFGVHLGDKLLFRPAGMHLSWQQSLVILITVAISASTTFMTVRQSAKRGLMQTNVDPDNPMAQSQKYMQYIIPFFSLTGLYWQYGLVLYWVTTNLWTLGQQFLMFRNWSTEPVGAEGALAGANTGGPAKTTQSSVRTQRQGSGTAKAASSTAGTGSTSGTARTGTASSTAGTRSAGGARTGTTSGRPASAGSARAKGGQTTGSGRSGSSGSASARTGTASRPATTASGPVTEQNGGEKRGLLRLGRSKQEPEPQDDVPTTKVVRQQPVRQAKSKRSGKR
jgi:hypothetical protein